MDKRQDWWPGILSFWTEKLASYQESEVCEALKLYAGEFFPSVDDIAALIERRRINAAQNKQWDQWKATQKQAAAEGKLATDEDYAQLREVFRRVAFGEKPNEQRGKAADPVSGQSGSTEVAVAVQPGPENG